MMRIALTLAAGFVLTGTALAAPAMPQPGVIAGSPVETVEWHPSTRHWDHHFHAHQESLRYHEPTEAEIRIHRSLRRSDPYAHGAGWGGPRQRIGDGRY